MPSQETEVQNLVIGIIGHKGTGKTTQLIELLAPCDRFLLVDIKGEHEWVPNELHSLEQVRDFFKWNRKKAQWAATFIPGDELDEEISEVARMCHERGDMTLGLEEVSEYTKPGYTPKKLRTLILLGRTKQVDIIWTVQRFAEVSKTLTSQSDQFIFFLQTEPRDLDAIADRTNSEVAAKVQNLGMHGWLKWDKIRRVIIEESSQSAPPAPSDAPANN